MSRPKNLRTLKTNFEDMTVPKECITLYYSGDTSQDTYNNKPIRPAIRVFPEAFGTNELEYCEPVNEVELVSKELNHLSAILHVYAWGLNFMK